MSHQGDYKNESITVIKRILSFFIKQEFAYLFFSFAKMIAETALPFISIILPALIIEELLTGLRAWFLISISFSMILLKFILEILRSAAEQRLQKSKHRINEQFLMKISEKAAGLGYTQLDNHEQMEKMRIARENLNRVGGITEVVDFMFSALQNMFIVLLSAALASTLNIYLIIIAVITIIIHTYIQSKLKKIDIDYWDHMVGYNMRFFYIVSVILNKKYAQDIRIYEARETFNKQMDAFVDYIECEFGNRAKKQSRCYVLFYLADVLQQLCIYGYLAYVFFQTKISLGSFMMYTTTIQTFTSSAADVMKDYLDLMQKVHLMADSFSFLDLETRGKAGREIPVCDSYRIEVEDVSFRYPGQEHYAIRHVNLSIASGEKICIVGMNGSGKSTLVKLIMRLYEPTDGRILLNGCDILSYRLEDYYKLFSPVFQDFEIFDSTFYENIKVDTDISLTKDVDDCLKRAGLYDKVCSLKQKGNTHISKQFYKDGIELSGGESQKLAVARAFYKNAPIFIFDEPTAALDPKSENDIFTMVNRNIDEKTTIYVSHRMASCVFSDRIAVMHEGCLIQLGSHEDLYSHDGKYSEMFKAQAQYYIH